MAEPASRASPRQPIQIEESNVLTTVIRRLEAATSRLEDIASTSVGFDVTSSQLSGASAGAGATKEASPAASLPPSIQAFDALQNNELKAWLDLSASLGDVIDKQVW